MQREESFDSFYQSTRRNLLLQTFALTGDLTAAQSAVKDAYVAAWHLWRKVGPLEDREGWVRARAWQLAQRRHAGRIWHRNKGIGEDDRYVLDALAKGRGQTLAQMSLAWVLRHPGMTSALIGASKVAQLEDAVGALDQLGFTLGELAEIERVLA